VTSQACADTANKDKNLSESQWSCFTDRVPISLTDSLAVVDCSPTSLSERSGFQLLSLSELTQAITVLPCVWEACSPHIFRNTNRSYCVLWLCINSLTSELNPSAQRCLTRFLLGILLLEPCISLIYAWKSNKCNNYSFSLLIMYGSSYMFRYYIAFFRERF
jgi:hypothetical protein